MRKTLLVATAAAFLGTTTIAPTPASAMFFALPLFIGAKVSPNWGAPAKSADTKKVMKHKKAKKVAKKSMKKTKKKM